MQRITPCLWFNQNGEEAAHFYVSVFGGKVNGKTRYPDAGKDIHGMEAGTVLTVDFEVRGYHMTALNGGPQFTFTPAISFMVNCREKDEVNMLWEKLIDGGRALMELGSYPFSERYGWLTDKYGLSWQLIATPRNIETPILPSLLFVGNVAGKAEGAIRFYTSTFERSDVGELNRYGAEAFPDREGSIMYGEFTLENQKFAAMDSAHQHEFAFNEALSLMVICRDQEEIDRLWSSLSAVPEAEQCGWLKDQYGVSWQIVGAGMNEILNDPDKEKANRAMQTLLQMKKIDMKKLEGAARG